MTKADLVERVTAQISRTAGPMISKKDCARVVDAFLEAVKESLQHQENIEVRGFGTFKIRRRKTRMARNPRTSARNSLLGLNTGTGRAATSTGSPVRGLRAIRVFRRRILKVPNPRTSILCCCLSASFTAS